jgi:hypothetical protein
LKKVRWILLIVFLLAFFHTSLLVGAIHQLPLGGAVYESHLKQTRGAWVYYPVKVYGAVGRLAWDSGGVNWILTRVYRPLLKRIGEDSGVETALRVLDIGLWNTITLISLALTVLLFLIPYKKKRPSRLYS